MVIGIGLVLTGFAVWTVFSLLPAQPGAAMRIREAWDTGGFWAIGVPVMLIAQALAGFLNGAGLKYQPLWTLGGLFIAVLLIRRPGGDIGLLPLALLFVGLPLYGVLLAAGGLGRWLGNALRT
jgi:hypothetical protein